MNLNVIEQRIYVAICQLQPKPLIDERTINVNVRRRILTSKIFIKFIAKLFLVMHFTCLLAADHTHQPLQHGRILQWRLAFVKPA